VNRSFLIVFIPAILVAIAYFLLSIYAGVKLSYPRIIGAGIGFAAAVYFVHRYDQRKRQRRSQSNAGH
jgi:L-lactate permease